MRIFSCSYQSICERCISFFFISFLVVNSLFCIGTMNCQCVVDVARLLQVNLRLGQASFGSDKHGL